MKKYLYLIGSVSTILFATSCKKDYTCECTRTSWNSSSGQTVTDAPEQTTILEVSRKTAKDVCVSKAYSYTWNNGTTNVQSTTDYDCALK